jgi:hypothetical protein
LIIIVCHALPWASAAVGFLAAILWFIASTVRVPYKEPTDNRLREFSMTEDGVDILKTAKKQTWWNKWAALATCVSIALQAASLLCPN